MAKKKVRRITKRSTTRPQKESIKPAVGAARRKYARNFLSKVIARLDFDTGLSLSESAAPRASASIQKRFPSAELQLLHEQHIEVAKQDVLTTQLKTTNKRKVFWKFHTKSRDAYLEVGENSLAINYHKYDSFERLESDFLLAMEHFLMPIQPLTAKRLGLRYVDTVELDERKPTEWDKYLNPHLLAAFNLADDRKTISRVFNVLEFNYGESSLRFQYGMPNADYPATIRKKVFVMDWDAYSNVPLEGDEIKQQLHHFHNKIRASFEEVITEALRKKMGKGNA